MGFPRSSSWESHGSEKLKHGVVDRLRAHYALKLDCFASSFG